MDRSIYVYFYTQTKKHSRECFFVICVVCGLPSAEASNVIHFISSLDIDFTIP